MANSVDPDQTAPIGAVCSGSTLFASILNSSVMLGNILQRRHFQMHFFGTLRVVLFVFLFDCNNSWPQIVETYNSIINTKRVGTLNFIYQLPSSRVR